MDKRLLESKVLYEKSYPPFNWRKAKKEVKKLDFQIEAPHFDTIEDFAEYAYKDMTFEPIPERQKAAKIFIDRAIEISEFYEMDIIIEERFDQVSVCFNFEFCPNGDFLKPLFLMADNFEIIPISKKHRISLLLTYYTHAAFRRGKQIRPSTSTDC